MDPQRIKACIDAMAASDLAEMEFSQDGWTLRLVRRGASASALAPAPAPALATASALEREVPREDLAASTPPDSSPRELAAATRELSAPLYGVVHLAPGPGEPAFVSAGQAVSEGQILCVIEAMKVFNQVRAEHAATVAEILVTPGQEVDAGQALMRFA